MQSLNRLLYLENRTGVSKSSLLILNDMSTYVLWHVTLIVVARFGDKLSVWYNSTTRWDKLDLCCVWSVVHKLGFSLVKD